MFHFSDLIDVLGPLFVVIFVIAAVFFGIVCGFGKVECDNYAKITGRKTRFVVFGGCFVRDGGEWLSRAEYQAVITAREGLKGGNHGE